VDPDRIGIIGFSRTCYYVLEALTASTLRFRAALIADGTNEGYMQYMMHLDLLEQNHKVSEEPNIIGGQPFGAGLNLWLTRSPLFNMDRVTAPLEVVAASRTNLLLMWEPYATLRYLRKPVDLVLLNSEEHVFTNPVQRLISQGITVDWFRFWLQDYQDPDPTKQEQYNRWNGLRTKPDFSHDGGDLIRPTHRH
jgi:dipeptidyl aminopeptidase/acylaminoacyl peptidase